MKKHTKNRKSKIDRLPDDVRSTLNMLLREGRMSQQEIIAEINAMIVENGISEDSDYIKRNSMSRYAQAFEKGMEKYRQTQQMTEKWVQQFGEMPQTDIARGLIEIGKSQIFDFQMQALEDDETIDPKTMGQMALAIKRLQEAQAGSVKLEKEIRKQALEDAEKAVTETVTRLGLGKEAQQVFKDSFLGLKG
jgi:hypothetical protein